MKWFLKLLPPGLPLVPSFAEASKPDLTFTVAGLQFGAHSDGLPPGLFNYITVQHIHHPAAVVPEPGAGVMLAVGLVVVGLVMWRKGLTK